MSKGAPVHRVYTTEHQPALERVGSGNPLYDTVGGVAPCRYKDKCPPASSEDTSAGHGRPGRLRRVEAGSSLRELIPETTKSHERWERQAKLASSAPFYPSHVQACANNDLPALPWVLHTWKRDNPLTRTRLVYTCNSYRCPSPQCQQHAAHVDFARIKEGLEGEELDPMGWVFLVLTIDQRHTYGTGREYVDEQDAFKSLSNNTRYFLRRLRRHQKALGWRVLDNEWVGTIEVQRNGWPHMNLILYSPELAEQLRAEREQLGKCKQRQLVTGWLKEAVTSTNWGTISTAEGARNRDALAGYVTKVAGNFARTSGEVAKITQAPTNARMKLRRIRAGVGFLRPQGRPAGWVKGEWTGVMLKRRVRYGATVAAPMLEPDQVKPVGDTPEKQLANYERYALGVRLAIEAERTAIRNEAADEALARSSPGLRYIVKMKQQERRRLSRGVGKGVDCYE